MSLNSGIRLDLPGNVRVYIGDEAPFRTLEQHIKDVDEVLRNVKNNRVNGIKRPSIHPKQPKDIRPAKAYQFSNSAPAAIKTAKETRQLTSDTA